MENIWEKILNLIFHIYATIDCKFEVYQSCRAQWGLSYHSRAFLNPLSEFWEKFKIKTFTIRNVLECMENIWAKTFNLVFHIDATIDCKFEVYQSCKAQWGLSYHSRAFLNPLSECREKSKIKL